MYAMKAMILNNIIGICLDFHKCCTSTNVRDTANATIWYAILFYNTLDICVDKLQGPTFIFW